MASALLFSPIALLRAVRPLQWVKNGLVVLPFVFAVNLAWSTDDLGEVPGLLVDLLLVALAFCALSSAVYPLNDLMDCAGDRRHPVKRNRPIASGKASVPTAATAMVLLAAAGSAGTRVNDRRWSDGLSLKGYGHAAAVSAMPCWASSRFVKG